MASGTGAAEPATSLDRADSQVDILSSTFTEKCNQVLLSGGDESDRNLQTQSSSVVNQNADTSAPNIGADVSTGPDSWAGDPQNPKNWSLTRKYTIIVLTGTTNIVAAMCVTAFEPALPSIMQDFHSTNDAAASLTVTIYVLGYVIGPLILAPVSELYGRIAVLGPAYALFIVTLVVCGISTVLSEFLIIRLVMGFAAIGFGIVGPAIVADMISEKQRGLAISVLSGGLALGPTLGPILGGHIAENVGWRWIFWTMLIARPYKIFFQSPMVPLFALYTSVLNSYMNILFATLGTVFEFQYSFTPGQSGLAYLGLTAGFLVSMYTIGPYSDRRMATLSAQHAGVRKPEWRLPPLVLGSLLLPAGFLWYGWAMERQAHWIVPILGTVVIAVGTMLSYMPVQYYIVDCFTLYAASAIGAVSIVRSICTAVIPLAANPLYDKLGYGWGNTLLAFIALPFAGFAVLLLRYGERIRTHPRWQPRL
ncbi:MAG: hypothetical protein Q9187_000655 [Circinaria calcarea]